MIYALFDGSAFIKREHLVAATAFWKYVEDSMYYVYGGADVSTLEGIVLQTITYAKQYTKTQLNALPKALGVRPVEVTQAVQQLILNGDLQEKSGYQYSEKGGRPSTLLVPTRQFVKRDLLKAVI
jgi:hypothetical protein